MELLVRDWQNFEDDEDLPACEAEMITYLETVLAERASEDLRATREKINSCFEDISCYLLTHPGFGVTKKKYTGDVNQVEPTFLALLDRYCKRVFENDDMANFGSAAGIEKARGKMEASIFEDFQLYNKLNDSCNPLAGFETYVASHITFSYQSFHFSLYPVLTYSFLSILTFLFFITKIIYRFIIPTFSCSSKVQKGN